jgi:hypothetical protein
MTATIPSETFSSHEEAVDRVTELLRTRLDVPGASLKAFVVAADAVDKMAIERPEFPKTASPAMVRSFRYVIRNDDLMTLSNFFDLLKAAGGMAVGIASLPTLAGIKALGDAAHAFYGVFKSIFAKGERLTPAEFLMLAALKEARAASAGEISERLGSGTTKITPDDVEKFFSRLERRGDKGFTRRVPPNSWCLDGI